MTLRKTQVLMMTLIGFTMGCTAAPGELMPKPAPTPTPDIDAGAPEASPPPPDASIDRPPEVTPDTLADGVAAEVPKPWPPPGVDYLTKLATEADVNLLSGPMNKSVPFIMRRRASDKGYPAPWDGYECVFEHSRYLHLEFLEAMDRDRAVYLYYADARGVRGTLIPGRLDLDRTSNPKVARILFENHSNLMALNNDFPLDAAAGAFLREQLRRCVPLVTSFTFATVCPGGAAFNCPLP